METELDFNLIVKHLANGSLASNLCLVCLSQLEENKYENIFTVICKLDKEYCIADILETVCRIKFDKTDNYCVCTDCFNLASTAYKFYLTAKRSHEVINFYTEELLSNLKNVHFDEDASDKILFIPLTLYKPNTEIFDYDYEGIGQCNTLEDTETLTKKNKDKEYIVCVENNKKIVYELKPDGTLQEVKIYELSDVENSSPVREIERKVRKKRDPLSAISCSRCPVKYRFVGKLKDHMKNMHDVDLYYCKICKLLTEQKSEYEAHILTHKGEYQCATCHAVFKKKDTLSSHIKTHEKSNVEKTETSNICEVCGVLLEDEARLAEHAEKHEKRFTCYYCGRMYRGQGSFDAHIHKHEARANKDKAPKSSTNPPTDASKSAETKRSICTVCNKSFVDERSLMWHQRLHNNDKPYSCKVCGMSFVSANRRNQHWVCAHTPPARRCPLCPALFHQRSMVNTHLKKVHLTNHKRRNRSSKYKNVHWRTETVPIQELSVSIQDEILELKNMQDYKDTHW